LYLGLLLLPQLGASWRWMQSHAQSIGGRCARYFAWVSAVLPDSFQALKFGDIMPAGSRKKWRTLAWCLHYVLPVPRPLAVRLMRCRNLAALASWRSLLSLALRFCSQLLGRRRSSRRRRYCRRLGTGLRLGEPRRNKSARAQHNRQQYY
jgi:hypothetical protein